MEDLRHLTIEKLINDHKDGIWRYTFTSTKQRHVADDLTQEVFVQAYIHLSDFRNESSLRTWLFSIARNKCIDYFRSAMFRRIVTMSDAQASDIALSAESQALQNIEYSELLQMIMGLPRLLREVVVLRIQEELSFSDIGRIQGIREGTARVRYKRSIKRLRDNLSEEMMPNEA